MSNWKVEHLEKPLKVAFVECAAAMGGVQFSTLYLAEHLDRAVWDPLVVCPEEGDLTAACRKAGIEVHVLKQSSLRSTSVQIGNDVRVPNPAAWLFDFSIIFANVWRLVAFLKQTKPDLIVTKGLFSHFYGGLAARRVGIPCVWHVQDFISERFLGLYRRFFGLTARMLPNHVIADGTAIARQLNGIRDRVSVVLNGVDSQVFKPGTPENSLCEQLGIPAGKTIIGHVGRMTPWKGQHYLLEAFAQVATRDPNTYLVFVGEPVFDTDAYQQRLFEFTTSLGLGDRVKFAGYRHDLPDVLASMDLFAFTSVEKDTSPLTLLSAMATGLPIVAFDIEGVRELMNDEQVFLCVAPRNVDKLADAILSLLDNAELRERLGSNARDRVLREFDLARHVTSVERVLLSVYQKKRDALTGRKPSLEYTLTKGGTVAKNSIRS